MPNQNNIFIYASILAALGMWLLLPRGGGRGRWVGALLAAMALGLCASRLPYLGDWISQSVFYILAAVTLVSAVAAISFRNPLYCAIWFGLTLLGIAGLFLVVDAQFLAVATIVVYAGAILVTFLFVIMLAQPEGKADYDRVSWDAPASSAIGMLIVGVLSTTICNVFNASTSQTVSAITVQTADKLNQGVLSPYHVASIGMDLFGRYMVAIEVTGVLLLVAIVGAAVIIAQAKNTIEQNPKIQRQSSDP